MTGPDSITDQDQQPAEADPALASPQSGGFANASLTRSLASLAAVWVVSAIAYFAHVSVIPAIAFLVCGILFLKIGSRVVDRFLAILIAAVTYVVLIAWISPMIPALIHPITLVGILGTVPAIAWAMGKTARPQWALADGISIGVGVVSAGLWFLPVGSWDRARMIDVLFFGPDNAPHLAMFNQVWRVHGYEFLANSPNGNFSDFSAYPEAAHAIFTAVGSVMTSSFSPPDAVPLELFTLFSCLTAGLLALVLAWAVDRLIRGIASNHRIRSAIAQLVPPVILIVGPAAWILMSSVSFSVAAVLLVTAFALLATPGKRPRFTTLLVASSIVGMCAAYPLLGIFAPMIWIALLLVLRDYVMKHRIAYAVITTLAVLASAPMFLMLILREADHNLDTQGVFEPVPIALYVGSAFALAAILVVGTRAIPKPILRFAWPTAVATLLFSIGAIVQWQRLSAVPYYSVKSMYATLLLTIVALAAAVIAFSVGWEPIARQPRTRRQNVLVTSFAASLAALSGVAGVLLVTVQGNGQDASYSIVPGYHWMMGDTKSQIGETYESASTVSGPNRDPVIIPCEPLNTFMRWQTVLTTGRYGPESAGLLGVSCNFDKFVTWVQEHPKVQVDAYVKDEEVRKALLAQKQKLGLSNLRVIFISAN